MIYINQQPTMIYINQIGTTELGRGPTIEDALADAEKNGFGVIRCSELRPPHVKDTLLDGECYWTDEPQEGYNA